MSKIADEERQKRPDYRPVIEYDGFLRHRSSNQVTTSVRYHVLYTALSMLSKFNGTIASILFGKLVPAYS